MRRRSARGVIAVVLAALSAGCLGLASNTELNASEDRAPAVMRGTLIELFTSQGCSSCPPADRLLTELGQHDDLIALSFHVDYWNHIGWTDPFSSRDWSNRQRSYAKKFGSQRIYTPQVVVNGRWEAVGSDRRNIETSLAKAVRTPDQLRLDLRAEPLGSDALRVRVTSAWEASPISEPTTWLAVVERHLVTPVGRGENNGKTLRNDHVVRRLLEVSSGVPSVDIVLDPSWNRNQLGLVAFVQDGDTLAVRGAAKLDLRL